MEEQIFAQNITCDLNVNFLNKFFFLLLLLCLWMPEENNCLNINITCSKPEI